MMTRFCLILIAFAWLVPQTLEAQLFRRNAFRQGPRVIRNNIPMNNFVPRSNGRIIQPRNFGFNGRQVYAQPRFVPFNGQPIQQNGRVAPQVTLTPTVPSVGLPAPATGQWVSPQSVLYPGSVIGSPNPVMTPAATASTIQGAIPTAPPAIQSGNSILQSPGNAKPATTPGPETNKPGESEKPAGEPIKPVDIPIDADAATTTLDITTPPIEPVEVEATNSILKVLQPVKSKSK